ncbi:MAG: hypothetical protein H6R19_3381, partial [Proteobacteria bacterium]|nr:hypothetical protein [Pseudomonadota bacterium]
MRLGYGTEPIVPDDPTIFRAYPAICVAG